MEKKIESKPEFSCLQVISHFINLTKKGGYYFGCCPFHNEKTASFAVNTEKNFWKCYGCGEGGNAIGFVMKYKDVDFKEALELCSSITGMEVETKSNKKVPFSEKREPYKIMSEAFERILNNTYPGEVGLKYLKSRGITEEIIKENKIGYCPENYADTLINLMKGYNFSDEASKEFVLNGKSYFEKRIIFPVEDDFGVVGFVSRTIEKDNDTKYLNSKESVLFKRNKTLFNYKQAKENWGDKKEINVVEGIFDALALKSIGLKNVVATLGTNVSFGQIEKLSKANIINIFFDNDKAGRKGAINLYKKIKQYNYEKEIKIVVIENKDLKDPDEMVKANSQAKKKNVYTFVNECPELSEEEKIETMFECLKTENLEQTKKVFEFISKEKNIDYNVVQHKYLQYISQKEKVSEDYFLRAIVKGFEDKKDFLKFAPYINKNLFSKGVVSLFKKFSDYYKNNEKFNLNKFSKLLTEKEKMFVHSLEGEKYCKTKYALSQYYSKKVIEIK